MMKVTLVLGASLKEGRYSNTAIKKLRARNIATVALGSRSGTVKGVTIETKKKVFEDIHTITLYLNPKRQEEYYEYMLSLNPTRVIFNPGTENLEFMNLLEKNNVQIEVACTLVLLSLNQYE